MVSRPYRPREAWFVRSPWGIHGLAHEVRVLVLGQLLARRMQAAGTAVDERVVNWAAAVHDTQRFDDGIDPEHGFRAAEWIRQNPTVLSDAALVAPVAYVCEWHVPSDSMAPDMSPELSAFKDADALDRWRIGDFDPTYLRTAQAQGLIKASQELWEATRRPTPGSDTFAAILRAAMRIGLIAG